MPRQIIKDTFVTVWHSLFAHKLRSALTLLGVIIGVTVVVLIGAILASFSAAVTDNINVQGFAPNVIYVTKEDKIGPQFGSPTAEERMRKDLSYESILAVAALESPLAVSPQKVRGDYGPTSDPPTLTARGRQAISPLVLGVWETFPDVTAVNLAQGRFFTEAERKRKAPLLVIGWSVAEQLFEATNALGETVRLDGNLYEVIGVLKNDGDQFSGQTVYAPYETIARAYPNIKDNVIVVRAPPERTDEVINEVTYTLRKLRHVPVEAPNNFGVTRAEQVFAVIQQMLNGIASIVAPIALAGLVVGGVGVMNIMIVSVTERTAEIGLRRALGARRCDVLTQFLTEAILLTTFGGIFGITLGCLLAYVACLWLGVPLFIPSWAVLTGLLTSALVGLLAGVYPATRAARFDPVEAMRGR